MLIGYRCTLETLKWMVSSQPWGVTAHRTSADDERPAPWPAIPSHLCILTWECVRAHGSVCVLMCACRHLCLTICYISLTFNRRFYPKRLTGHSGYTFFVSMCVLWELNPQPFALLTQCSTTEPQEHEIVKDGLFNWWLVHYFLFLHQYFDMFSSFTLH